MKTNKLERMSDSRFRKITGAQHVNDLNEKVRWEILDGLIAERQEVERLGEQLVGLTAYRKSKGEVYKRKHNAMLEKLEGLAEKWRGETRQQSIGSPPRRIKDKCDCADELIAALNAENNEPNLRKEEK